MQGANPCPTNQELMKKKKYKWLGKIVKDGDKFQYQAEPKGRNPYNPSGIAIGTFNHKSYTGWEELK